MLRGETAPTSTAQMSDNSALERAKRFTFRHFERLLVVFLVASLLLIHFYIDKVESKDSSSKPNPSQG